MAKKPATTKPYTQVRRAIWDSRRFSSLPNDACRYLYLYFLTSPHQTGAGCFKAKAPYILADLNKPGSDFTLELYAERLAHLVAAGLILADDETGEILITGWWKDNGPSNMDWMKGAQRQCNLIESPTLQEAALKALADSFEAFQQSQGLSPTRPSAPAPAVSSAVMARINGGMAR